MKSFDEFQKIAYYGAVPHTVYSQGKSKRIPKGQAVPVRSRSSARGGHGGHGGNGVAGGNGGGNGGE